MRVAFLTNSFPKPSETFILRQATGLLDAGHDVRVVSAESPTTSVRHDAVREYRLQERTTYLSIPHSPLGAALTVSRSVPVAVAHPAEVIESLRRGRSGVVRLECIGQFRRTVSSLDPDIYHAHFGGVGSRWDFVPALSDVPFVASFYGMDASSELRANPERYEMLFDRADFITVLSDDMRGDLSDAGCPRDRARIVPLPVDLDQFTFRERAPPESGPVRIATVARLVEKKGVDDALRAVASVAADHDVRYEIVGDGPLRSDLDALAGSLGIEELVTFHGFVSSAEVSEILDDVHLFLHPSKVGSDGSKEGTPTAIIEAQAKGLPVVSTRHAGIPSIVNDGEAGVLVPEGDVGALTDALDSLLVRPDQWADMGRAGREFVVANHSISAVSERLIDLYGSVSGGLN